MGDVGQSIGYDQQAEKVMQAVYKAIGWHEPTDALTLKDWLLQVTDNQSIHNIFQAQATAFVGVNYHDFPSGEFFRFLRSYARLRGALVPKNTGRTIIEALGTAIEAKGGKVLTATRAKQILVNRGRSTGVIAEKGGKQFHIEAKAVVSNAGPKKTLDLAGESCFDNWYVKQVREEVKPAVAMNYIFVSERPLVDSLLFTLDARRTECWCPTSLIWPDEAPQGLHTLEGVAGPH
jgi:phytoene desaturase